MSGNSIAHVFAIRSGVEMLRRIGIDATMPDRRKKADIVAQVPGGHNLGFLVQCARNFHGLESFSLSVAKNCGVTRQNPTLGGMLGAFESLGYHIAKQGKIFEPNAPGVFMLLCYNGNVVSGAMPDKVLMTTRESLLRFVDRHSEELVSNIRVKASGQTKKSAFAMIGIRQLYAEERCFWGGMRDMLEQHAKIDIILKYSLFPCRTYEECRCAA